MIQLGFTCLIFTSAILQVMKWPCLPQASPVGALAKMEMRKTMNKRIRPITFFWPCGYNIKFDIFIATSLLHFSGPDGIDL